MLVCNFLSRALRTVWLSCWTWTGSGALARRAGFSLACAPNLPGVFFSIVLCVLQLFYWIWTDSGAWVQRACSSFEGFTLIRVDRLRGGPLRSLVCMSWLSCVSRITCLRAGGPAATPAGSLPRKPVTVFGPRLPQGARLRPLRRS